MTLEAEDKELSESVVKSSLERLREQYEKSKNPVYAMEAFIMANERGDLNIPIPHWVKRWINSAFIEYWNSSGKEKLETLLGFQYGKGKSPSKDFEKCFIIARDDSLLWHMCILRRFGNLKILEAAERVVNRSIKIAPQKMKGVSPETLRNKYIKRKWRARESNILNDLPQNSKESCRKFILKEHGVNPDTDKNNCSNSSEQISEIEKLIYRNKWSDTK